MPILVQDSPIGVLKGDHCWGKTPAWEKEEDERGQKSKKAGGVEVRKEGREEIRKGSMRALREGGRKGIRKRAERVIVGSDGNEKLD